VNRLARAAKPEHISRMTPKPRILFLAVLLLWPAAAEAQFWSPFWSPWSSRGYRPPRDGGTFDTLRPWGEPRPRAQPKKAPESATKEAPPAEERPVPYDTDLARLSEILGALHYLRPLCGEQDKERWRKEMQDLLDTEKPSRERKERLMASFNRGYQSYELTYRNCTPSANLAIARSLDEGAKLARDIATKYGN
jgi:uncharacterized protein (TIGR02301 family)